MPTPAVGHSKEVDEGEMGSLWTLRREGIGECFLAMCKQRADEGGEAPIQAGRGLW